MITSRQYQILDFISDTTTRLGWSPTIREIMERVGLKSTSTISSHLASLTEAGLIERGPKGHPRMLSVTPEGEQAMEAYLRERA